MTSGPAAPGDPPSELAALPFEIATDGYAVRRALEHLLDNAVRYTERGHIDLELTRTSGEVTFRLADTGIGIAEDYLPCLGQPFTQESSGFCRSHEGLGLGLALARRYLEATGARLDIESRKGAGTTVRIRCVPYVPRPPAPQPPHGAAQLD